MQPETAVTAEEFTQPPILVAGLARSGTTWLAKILDSHPATLYRHEPDSHPLFPELPVTISPDEFERYAAVLQSFASGIPNIWRLRTAATLPVFRKGKEGSWKYRARQSLVYLLRSAERLAGNIRIPGRLQLNRAESLPSCMEICLRSGPPGGHGSSAAAIACSADDPAPLRNHRFARTRSQTALDASGRSDSV